MGEPTYLGLSINSIGLGFNGSSLIEPIIERARQMNGTSLWAIRRNPECMNRNGEWEYEPLPSYRDDEFLARCRFKTIEEALEVYCKSVGR